MSRSIVLLASLATPLVVGVDASATVRKISVTATVSPND
jgi:hypothetical protein